MGEARTPREGATRGLTATQVAALDVPSTGRRYVSVGGVTGLQLMLTAAGARTWVLQYRRPGEGRAGAPVRYTIGDARALSLAEARREAERLRGAIARGEDPSTGRRERLKVQRETAQAERAVLRMDDHVKEWLAHHIATKKKPQTLTQYTRLWKLHGSPTLGRKKAVDVTFSHVDALHRSLRDTKTTANRVVAMLSSFFGWCETHGITPRQSNPARGIERYPEDERERYLTPEEVQRFGEALRVAETEGLRVTSSDAVPKKAVQRKLKAEVTARQQRRRNQKAVVGQPYNPDVHRPKMASAPVPADPYAVAALRFALLSGWRIGEVCALRWDAIDKVRAVATLGDTKTGRAVRPIGAAALLLLEDLPRVKDSPFVFPSSRRGLGVKSSKADVHRPITAPRRLWEAVRDHAQLKGVRIHDLRHSFGATAADAGNSLILIASLLGHKQTRTSERYAKARRDVRQEAADEVSNELAGLLSASVTRILPAS